MKKSTKILVIVILFLVVAGGITGLIVMQNAKRARQAAQFEQAAADLEDGRYAEAMEAFGALKEEQYAGATEKYSEAKEGLLQKRKSEGDWDGVLELATNGNDRREAIGQKAVAMAREGRADEALAYLDSVKGRDYSGKSFEFEWLTARAQVLSEAGRWAEAEEIYQNYANGKSNSVWDLVRDQIAECIANQYREAVAAADTEQAEKQMEKARKLYSEHWESEQLQSVLIAPIQKAVELGAYAEAAGSIDELRHEWNLRHCTLLRAKLDELAAEAAYAFIHAGDYEALINSPIKSDFSKLSHEDPSMYAAYYLAVTRRAALIGTNADFNTLIEALPDNYSHDGEALFKELYIASGDPAVQYASARAYAREHESEAEFLNLGMELSAKAAAGEDTGIPMLAETLALLPSASVLPGGSHAIWEDDFPFALEEQKEVGSYDLPEIDFRAKEPYPLNYAVVVDNSSMRNPFASLDNPDTGLYAAKLAIGALAKAGTDSKAYRYNVIENPDAAAFLIRVHIYYNTIAGKYYPSNAIRLTERDAYQCYLECATYNLYDTETGKRIARGTLTADTPDHVLTENFYKQSFWVKIDHYGDADEKAAKAFRAITDAKVQALDDK